MIFNPSGQIFASEKIGPWDLCWFKRWNIDVGKFFPHRRHRSLCRIVGLLVPIGKEMFPGISSVGLSVLSSKLACSGLLLFAV